MGKRLFWGWWLLESCFFSHVKGKQESGCSDVDTNPARTDDAVDKMQTDGLVVDWNAVKKIMNGEGTKWETKIMHDVTHKLSGTHAATEKTEKAMVERAIKNQQSLQVRHWKLCQSTSPCSTSQILFQKKLPLHGWWEWCTHLVSLLIRKQNTDVSRQKRLTNFEEKVMDKLCARWGPHMHSSHSLCHFWVCPSCFGLGLWFSHHKFVLGGFWTQSLWQDWNVASTHDEFVGSALHPSFRRIAEKGSLLLFVTSSTEIKSGLSQAWKQMMIQGITMTTF